MLKLLLEVLRTLERFLDRRSHVRAERDEKQRRAVEAVFAAALETEAYLYDFRQSSAADRSRELRLAQLWRRAAVEVRVVDGRLSGIARLESLNWANPDLDAEARQAVAERLDLVRRQCSHLLAEWDRSAS